MTIKKIKYDNIFTSKANVLKFLESKLKSSKIEKVFYFTVDDWKKNEEKILKKISILYKNNHVIVRSSAIGEDSLVESKAGSYDSILDINPVSKRELKSAISKVIVSYKRKGNDNIQNQILIQKQINNSILNGVIFTRTANGAPYYIINYDETRKTDSVTKGQNSKVVKILRDVTTNKIPDRWKPLIKSIKEIESILKHDRLDIEFCFTKKKLIIFQVRPITTIDEIKIKNNDKKILQLIQKNKKKFKELSKPKKVSGKNTVFSDMSDWNPSEIIGNNPHLLDYSLYQFLIMNDAWSLGREKIGYQSVMNYPLMIRFGNKPYVDLRASFNSLIPDKFNTSLRNKLIKYYFKKLFKFPYLHDKVEFEILFTCYDMNLKNRLSELIKSGFSNKEINEINFQLIEFTNRIIDDFDQIANECDLKIQNLNNRRELILKHISKNPNFDELLLASKELLIDCKNLGTIPFSTMARIAFISSTILKSFEKKSGVSKRFIEDFMKSIATPLSEFKDDVTKLQEGNLTEIQFLSKYGHLRPGTYDITAMRYDKQPSLIHELKNFRHNQVPKKSKINIPMNIDTNPIRFTRINFLDFVKESLVRRERLKFEFTKSLSEALELIALAGNDLGFTRDDLSNVSINDIFRVIHKNKKLAINQLNAKIFKEKRKRKLNEFLNLPPLIFSEDNFEFYSYYVSKPNFISTKQVTGEIVYLNKNKINVQLNEKIILIENADPGYDWIFTKNPKALITKYGGVASHMAIRCSEIGLPAAIGCGELFDKLLNSKKILLDCNNDQIISLELKKTDEFMEVKKTLKSLGYIK